MSFFLLHRDSHALPEPVDVRKTRGERWVMLGGNLTALAQGPRRERLLEHREEKYRPGPRWITAPQVWRVYGATGSLGTDDPLDILFFKFDLGNLVYEGASAEIDPDHIDRLTNCASAFEAMVETLCGTAQAIFFLHKGERARPEKCDLAGLTKGGRPAAVLERLHNFQMAAQDSAAFVAWWTLTFRGWELALEDWQVELVRSCAFETREKKGGFLNLSTEYHLANFEQWINHGVPVYYLWSEVLHHDKRFARANPDTLREYWQLRQSTEDDDRFQSEIRSHFLRTERAAVFQYDNFFQDKAARSLLLNTEKRSFEPGTTYVLEAFQGYCSYVLRDRVMIERLLERYESVRLPGATPPKVAIIRWAPREPWKGQIDDEEYTTDYGEWEYELEHRFPGQSFNEEAGWISSDLLALRELFKIAFAPEPGEAFMPDGTRLQDPLARASDGSFVEKFEARAIREAVSDGKTRPAALREYYEYELQDLEEKRRPTRELLARRMEEMSAQEREEEDAFMEEAIRRAPPAPSPPPDIHDMPILLRRMIFPNWQAVNAGDEGSRMARRDRGSYAQREASRGGSSSASSRIVATASRRSASPSRGPARLADPTRLSDEVYRPGDEGYEEAVTALIDQLELLYTVSSEPDKRRPDCERSPLIGWDVELVERGYIHFFEHLDALRALLYSFFMRSLITPAQMLNYLVYRGIKFRLFLPRDPIPSPSRGLSQPKPSGGASASLQGQTGENLFQSWQDAMLRPFWEKTHFAAFIQEGVTVGFLTRHYAYEKLKREAGVGVSLESRIFTRNSDFLPDSNETFQVVHDAVHPAEKNFVLGTTPGSDPSANVRHMFPPTHTFEHKYWNLGTGEWTDWEEDYLLDLLERWKQGKEVPRTVDGWASHMRVYRNNLARSRSLAGRDNRCPGSTEAAKWCRMLKTVYGTSIRTRKISSLTDAMEPLEVRRFV
ncbi:hypothetical protein GGG16DRAFT_119824 [Schizophyllum commune]